MTKKKPAVPKKTKKPKAKRPVVSAEALRRKIERKQQEIDALEQQLTAVTSQPVTAAGIAPVGNAPTPAQAL